MITNLVLRCKKEWWEKREEKRLRDRGGLLEELVGDLELKKNIAVMREAEADAVERKGEKDIDKNVRLVEERYRGKIEELRRTFELAGVGGEEGKKRKVPDWCIDDITFSVMLDPVVVSTSSLVFTSIGKYIDERIDENGTIIRQILIDGTPEAECNGPINERTFESGGFETESCVERSLCTVSGAEWVGC